MCGVHACDGVLVSVRLMCVTPCWLVWGPCVRDCVLVSVWVHVCDGVLVSVGQMCVMVCWLVCGAHVCVIVLVSVWASHERWCVSDDVLVSMWAEMSDSMLVCGAHLLCYGGAGRNSDGRSHCC